MTRRRPSAPLLAWTRVALVAGLSLLMTLPPSAGAAQTQETAEGQAGGAEPIGWPWVRAQLGSGTPVATPSVIAPDEAYPDAWTGPLSGTFELVGVDPPGQLTQTPVELDEAPDPDAPGVVHGQVSVPPSPGRWIIDVVRRTPGGEVSAQLQTLVDPAGRFSVDLAAAAPGTGEWGLRLLDAQAGYAQHGATWPSPAVFEHLEVQLWVVTDAAYHVGTTTARVDGTFLLPESRPGAKVLRLVDTRTGQVLAEAAPDTGLVRSFDVPEAHPLHGRTYAYDQALALLTALSVGDEETARRLGQGLLALQVDDGPQQGALVASSAVLAPGYARPELRTGIHGVGTYALLRWLGELDPQDPARAEAEAGATWAVAWLMHQQVPEGPLAGLVTAGYGQDGPGGFDPDAALPWASTEHNLDAWHALDLAGTTLSGASGVAAGQAADRLDAAVMALLWDPQVGGFLQGRSPAGPDPTRALDVDSWGAVWLQATGRPSLAAGALARTADLAWTHDGRSGYAPHVVQQPLVWTEGTAGVALAQQRVGDATGARATLDGLGPAGPDGARPGATRDDAAVSMTTASAVAGVTWVLLTEQALAGRPSIWDTSAPTGAND
ncbi:hypothetical protein [uncultured Serinicoccus sp.]|uniref:hypothetical protein n=1 Tax=uncultured Serinicoccus sp. TaxID=735514 RepID=UPI00260C1F7F|nr:hypothetical protein [uncultured Serinicoccus sp.]